MKSFIRRVFFRNNGNSRVCKFEQTARENCGNAKIEAYSVRYKIELIEKNEKILLYVPAGRNNRHLYVRLQMYS